MSQWWASLTPGATDALIMGAVLLTLFAVAVVLNCRTRGGSPPQALGALRLDPWLDRRRTFPVHLPAVVSASTADPPAALGRASPKRRRKRRPSKKAVRRIKRAHKRTKTPGASA